ncbi:MAG: hypothetical protein MUE85_23825, partial [Microscillaceae bacterium]|nr:hypothetical protein [Microscillaceae bacterium]
KEDESTGKDISQEYAIYQRNKTLERLEYKKESIEVSKVDVFSFKRWDRHTYLTMKVYLMNYYLGAVLFLGTLVGGITIWHLINSNGDLSAINGGRSMTSEEEANMRLTFVIFSIGYIITVILATVVLWRWFAVQIPAKKAQQISIFKSILYEYIFETLPQNTLLQIEMLLDVLTKYRARLPKRVDIPAISSDEVIQTVLTEFKADPIAQETGRVAYSLAHIAQELNTNKKK